MNLCDKREVQGLLHRHGVRLSKSMGQNFLIDETVPAQIAALSGIDRSTGVLEIGPGVGALTAQLAPLAGKVVAAELDRSLKPVLEETLSPFQNVQILWGNILQVNLPALVAESFLGLTPVVCANLPYNITTPVLSALIDSNCFRAITVMVQREVALRICGAPGTGAYGAFSVYAQYHTQPRILFDVPPTCFLPPPKVTSSVIQLVPRKAPPAQVSDPALFFRIVKAAFAQRRKTLVNALHASFGNQLSKEILQNLLTACNLPLDVRGERLDISAFAALTYEIGAALSSA